MTTFREVFSTWFDSNPYHFQKTLLVIMSGAFTRFRKLADLSYLDISKEMFELSIASVDSARKRDNMRFLIIILDRYLNETGTAPIVHPTITTDAQAVWMVLHEPASLKSPRIRKQIENITGQSLPFEVLGAKHLVSLDGTLCKETIGYRRKAIHLCKSLYGRSLSAITNEELSEIIDSSPSWIFSTLRATLKEIFAMEAQSS